MNCIKCGNNLSNDDKVCKVCGNVVQNINVEPPHGALLKPNPLFTRACVRG